MLFETDGRKALEVAGQTPERRPNHRRGRHRGERHRSRLALGPSGDEIDTGPNPLDDGEVIEEEQVDDALVEQLRGELGAVERAEARLEDGTYGFSVESGEPIPEGRLKASPWAERTPEEQELYEGSRRRAL